MESLEPAAQAEVFLAVRLLREHGVSLGMPFARHLREGLWELRVRDPAGIYRIVYFHWKGRTFGFVHAFSKKTRATPPADIELALRRKLRNSLGLTQRQIAARAKMTQPEIARLESGGVEPNWETLRRVLGALGASIEIKARDPEGKLVKVTLSPGPEATKERQPKPKAVPRAS
jgi:phage-related protein